MDLSKLKMQNVFLHWVIGFVKLGSPIGLETYLIQLLMSLPKGLTNKKVTMNRKMNSKKKANKIKLVYEKLILCHNDS